MRRPRRERPGAALASTAAGQPLEAQHEQAEPDEHERERGRGGRVEAIQELGVDRRGERLEAEDLEGAVLGEHHERHEHAAPEDRAACVPERHAPERPQPPEPEAARDLLERRVGVAQARRDRQVDERVDRERHDERRTGHAADRREQRLPAEARHEVRDADRDDDEDGPQPPRRQVGALDAPGGERPDHGAQDGHDDRERHRVPQQRDGQVAEQERVQRRPAVVRGLEQQEHERQGEHDGDERAGEQQQWRRARPAGRHVVGADARRSRRREPVGGSAAAVLTAAAPVAGGQGRSTRRRATRGRSGPGRAPTAASDPGRT